MKYPTNLVKEVRDRSKASLAACATALDEAVGDVDRALVILQEKGIVSGAGRSKIAAEGRVQAYVHGEARITVVVEVNCETDFAARSAGFKEFCDLVAMQIAAHAPRWVSRADVDPTELQQQTEIFKAQVQGKPPHAVDKIVAGKLDKWYSEVCLLDQKPITVEGNEPTTIETLRALLSSKIGETVKIRRFVRWEVGEGVARSTAPDYATEVALLAGS
jgi:elongation factor Ts